tara:strand:+ start:2187 stop:2375 length:189 start_codon:yes stop_codon:yes gene_type:complete
MRNWVLVIYSNELKSDIVKVINVDSIKQVAYILNESPADISNYYHKLIKSKNLMKLIDIYKK